MVTYVYGNYQDYIPIYIYSILKSYPSYRVRIFFRETLQSRNKQALDAIRQDLSDHFEVRENSYAGPEEFEIRRIRWLLPREAFSGFDYAYIGDVDYIICREQPDILARHLGYCREMDLPYSNAVRVKSPPVKKLTGMQFIIVDSYYDIMAPAIARMKVLLNENKDHPLQVRPDEDMLYALVEDGIGRFPPLFFRPGHGIHLGALRSQRDMPRQDYRRNFPFIMNEMKPDPVYQYLKRQMSKDVRWQVLKAQALCGYWWHGLW